MQEEAKTGRAGERGGRHVTPPGVGRVGPGQMRVLEPRVSTQQ